MYLPDICPCLVAARIDRLKLLSRTLASQSLSSFFLAPPAANYQNMLDKVKLSKGASNSQKTYLFNQSPKWKNL